MKRICFVLVGIVAVFLAAGCFGGETETGRENERRAPTAESSPETKPDPANPATTDGSAPERVEAEVEKSGLHLEVGRYQIDAPPGVAPVGTTVEVVAFREPPSEVGLRGMRKGIVTLDGAEIERIASEEALSGVDLQNTGRGFAIGLEGNAQPASPIRVSFPSEGEYDSTLSDMGAGETAPVFLRERGDGLAWGAAVLSDPERDGFTATFAKIGTYYEAAFNIAYDVGYVLNDVADETFAKRTPRPSCHGQPVEAADGGIISVKTAGNAVWACLAREGDRVVVSLTNNYPAPLIVNSDPAAPFKLTSRKSTQDALVTAFGDYRDEVVLPTKGEAVLYYPADSLPSTIKLSTDYELASVQFFGAFLDAVGGSFDSRALKGLLETKGGVECFESIVLEESYLETTIDCGTLAAKEFGKLISLLFVAGDMILGYAGQVMEDYNGPYTVTIEHEPGSNDEEGSRFQQTWAGQITEFDNDPVSRYKVEAEIVPIAEMTEEFVGEVVGEISYSLGCSGVWTLKGVNANSVQVEEKIKKGVGPCVESVDITLTPQEGGTLSYYFPSRFNGYTGRGVLTRQENGTIGEQ